MLGVDERKPAHSRISTVGGVISQGSATVPDEAAAGPAK